MFAGNDNNTTGGSGPGNFAGVAAADAELDRLLSVPPRPQGRSKALPGWMQRLALAGAGLAIIVLMAAFSMWILAETSTDETLAVVADNARATLDEARTRAEAGAGSAAALQQAAHVPEEEPLPPLVMLPRESVPPAAAAAAGGGPGLAGGAPALAPVGPAPARSRPAVPRAKAKAAPAAPRALAAKGGKAGKVLPRPGPARMKSPAARTRAAALPKAPLGAARAARVKAALNRCRAKSDPACRPLAKAKANTNTAKARTQAREPAAR